MRTWTVFGWMLCCVAGVLVVGCGGGGESVSEDKPVAEVQAEAQKMSVDQLRETAKAYIEAIKGKQADLTKVQEKLGQLKPADLLGDEAKKINEDIANISKSVQKLQERLKIYMDELTVKGGDTSDLQL